MWDALLPLLADHHCITFDHPGAGAAGPASYDPQRHATLDGYADTVVALADELARPDLVFVGHSVSAMIGALAAVRAPQSFAALAMLCPSPCYLNEPPGYLGGFEPAQIDGLLQGLADGHAAWSHAVAPMIMGNPDRPALAATLTDSFCAMDPTIALRWARATFLTDLRAMVGAVTTPSLVMQCREDAIAPPAVGQWLASRLPRGRFAWLEAQGHCPHMSHPAEVARVLLEALRAPAVA
jgi:sigma-B regulation protein RsbQ